MGLNLSLILFFVQGFWFKVRGSSPQVSVPWLKVWLRAWQQLWGKLWRAWRRQMPSPWERQHLAVQLALRFEAPKLAFSL